MERWGFTLFAAFGALASAIVTLPGDAAFAQQTTFQKLPLKVVRPTIAQIAVQEKEITPPPSIAIKTQSDSVILKDGSTSTVMKSLRIKRQFPIATLRTSPVIALGQAEADLTPIFRNPASLINVSSRLRSQPALAQVLAEDTQILEVDQGLIIRQFLSYRIKPGVCSNSSRKSLLKRSGVACSTRMTDLSRAAAFTNPDDPHYIVDPAKRAGAISSAAQAADAEQQALTSGIAEFRTMMQNPAQRAQVEAEIGAGEAARMNALGDEQLAAELVNSAETQIEEVMFMPSGDKLYARRMKNLGTANLQKLQIPQKVDVEHSLQPQVFLTGFTLGRGNEWHKTVSVSVKWCVIGCKKTYYAKVYAGFGYGFGLRFPIKMGGLYAYHRVGDQESASVAPVFQPINGSENDYSETGLAHDQLFRGKELVAELTGYAGLAFKVPFHSDNLSANVGEDLTEELPAPFTDGQFQPPAPGPDNALNKDIIFDNPDLLAGLVNYGFVGAKVLPALRVGLTSDRLRLKLKDTLSGTEKWMENSGQAYPLAIDPNDHSSSFSIGYPEYDLGFQLTPGLAARLFVDVAVWSHNWDWPVWFPELAVKLPPDDATFTCHEQTICSRNYRYSPTLTQETEGSYAVPQNDDRALEVFNWRQAFGKKYLGQCPYLPIRFCEVAIRGVMQIDGNIMLEKLRAQPNFPSNETTAIIIKNAIEADKKGKGIILEARIVVIEEYGRSLFQTYEPIWGNDCADQLCRDRIHAFGGPYVQALANRLEAKPSLEQNEVVFLENTQGRWSDKAKQEVAASKARIASPGFTPIKRIKMRDLPAR